MDLLKDYSAPVSSLSTVIPKYDGMLTLVNVRRVRLLADLALLLLIAIGRRCLLSCLLRSLVTSGSLCRRLGRGGGGGFAGSGSGFGGHLC